MENGGVVHSRCCESTNVALDATVPIKHCRLSVSRNPEPLRVTTVDPATGPMRGANDCTVKNENRNKVDSNWVPSSAILRSSEPICAGMAHVICDADRITAAVAVPPNMHRGWALGTFTNPDPLNVVSAPARLAGADCGDRAATCGGA